MSWSEANAELVRELFRAIAARDGGAIQSRLADDVIWYTPGRGLLAGEVRGFDAVMGQLGRATEVTGSTLIIDVLDVMSSDRQAVAYLRATAERDGQRLDLQQLVLFTIVDGQVTRIDQAPMDLYAYDAFWA